MGLALGYSLMMGLFIVVGSLLPLFTGNPENILKPNGLAIIAGVAVIILGIIFNGWSAVIKERNLSVAAATVQPCERKPLVKGLIFCFITGLLGPALNYAFIMGGPLMASAENLGASKTFAANSIWAITLVGAFIVNTGYCGWLVNKSGSWAKFSEEGTGKYFLYTLIMGILWAGSIEYYGMATAHLGKLGPSIGWAISQATGIFTANVLGILTGEWKSVNKKARSLMVVGLFILLAGICIVAYANTL
jgi:L-rhamnose-H+ transport protein